MRRLSVIFLIICLILLSACEMINTTPTASSSIPSTTPQPSSAHSSTPTPTSGTAPTAAPAAELRVHFIDVGQGDAILIDLYDTEILIDAGDRSPGVIAYLSRYVDGSLEVIVATHPHADHIGGLIAVLNTFKVEEVWHNGDTSDSKTFTDFMNAVNAEGAEVHTARLHDVIDIGELELFVHHPADLSGSTNNNSIVLHLVYGDIDFLFTGDAEQEAEGHMMMLSSVRLPEVEILKVGHHGSTTASSADFLSITSPEVAIYMASEGNSYGHPHAETINALNAIGATIYGTDVNGTIIVITDGQIYDVSTER
ncbi:ComEC/Rec2 family competence protein [Chloroflexota bacterium]